MDRPPQESAADAVGPDSDVVISCRVRLARNMQGVPFVNRATEQQQLEVVNVAQRVLLAGSIDPGMIWVNLSDASSLDRQLLVERHLISKHHADAALPRGVAISEDESLSVMVNEEDHLRMQVICPGFRLGDAYERVNVIDDDLDRKLDFAFSDRWGYLTACPTNVGTGIRVSVMVHLPALKLSNEIDRVRRAAKDLHLAVRGYYGEGSESAGDFYQISNQVTLGRSEEDLLGEFQEKFLPPIIQYERQARALLMSKKSRLLDDRIHRALAILRSARMLGTEETMKMLSRIRLGVHLGRLPNISVHTVDSLFQQIQPAHLRMSHACDTDAEQIRASRADLVRTTLQSN